MRKSLILIFIFFSLNLKAQSLKCYFEEVYSDGSNQMDTNSDSKLRYEYFSEELYTLFYNYDDFYLVKNNDKNKLKNK